MESYPVSKVKWYILLQNLNFSLEVIYSALVNLGADASLLLPLVFLEQTLNKEIKDEQKHGRL